MTQITPTELSLYRTRPHRSDIKMVVYKPPVIMAAQVWGTVADHAELIPFADTTEGSYLNIRPGMTMYVGTAPGKADLGRIRLKDYASNVLLTVPRNSIRWSLNPYITVVDFYEIWPMYIQEIQSGTTTDHYKDWDVGYLAQNAYMGTLLAIGSHVVCNIGDSIYWSASGTVQTAGYAIEYSWVFGGTSETSSLQTPGNIQYNTPGYYTTRCSALITGAAVTDDTYRHVVVLGGAVQPYTEFGFDSIDGTRDDGGYHTKVWLRETNDEAVVDGSLIMFYKDDWYGSTQQNIGGGSRPHILFVGYVIENSISFDYQDSTLEFEIVSPTGRMKLTDSSSMEIDSVITPTNWYQIPYLNGKKALYHYLKWHTTVLNCCDIRWIADDRPLRYAQGEITSIYDLTQKMLNKYLLCEIVSDRQGILWVENHPMSVHDQTTKYNKVLDITKQDWMGSVSFDETLSPKLNYLEMGGLVYNGITGSIVDDVALTGSYTTVLSGAPGNNLRDYYGKPDLIQGYYISSQDENNQLAGDVFAYRNAKFPSVNVDMSGWYSNLDIAPQEIVTLTLNQADSRRGYIWNQKKFLIREVSINHKAPHVLLPSLNLYEVTQGVAGETIPVIPPATVNTPTVVLPPFNPFWPPIPPPGIPSFPPVIPGGTGGVCAGDLGLGNGPYTLMWDRSYVYGGETAYARFPCGIRRGNALYPTQLQLYLSAIGDGENNFTVAAVDAARNVVLTPSSMTGDINPKYVNWNPGQCTEVDGFSLTVAAGGSPTYALGAYLGSYGFSALDSVGVPLSGLTVGNWYAIQNTTLWYWRTPPNEWSYGINIYTASSGRGLIGLDSNGFNNDSSGFVAYRERIGSTPYGLLYFQAPAETVYVRCSDSVFDDNSGSGGAYLYNAVVTTGRYVLLEQSYLYNIARGS